MRCCLSVLLVLACVSAARAVPVEGDTSGSNRIFLRHIHINGILKTRRNIVLRELSVREENCYIRDSSVFLLEQNRLRLANAALFTTIELKQVPVVGDTVDWDISVKERWYIVPKPIFQLADRNFNVWWDEQRRDPRRANFGLTLTDVNFRGNAERVSGTVQLGYTQRFALEYTRPYLDRRQRHGLGGSLSMSQSGELYYATDSNKLKFARMPGNHIIRSYDAAAFYTYRPGFAVKHMLQLSYHDATISDTVLQLNRNYFRNGSDRLQYLELMYRMDINKVDNWNYPLRGFKMVSYALSRAGFKGMEWQWQLRTELGFFYSPKPRWFTSAIFRGRLSTPAQQPYYFRSGLGTRIDYVRGYEYYVMDGDHYGLLRLNLKRELFNKTVFELPFRYLPSLPLRIYPKIFADAGYIRDRYPGNGYLSNKMLYSAGIGVDVVTTYDIKLRIEFARNHLGENGLFLHLNSE